MSRAVVVTGLGLVSCAGEGIAAHLDALDAGARAADRRDDLRAVSRPSRRRRSPGTGRSRRSPTSARWRRGSASASTPPASPSTPPGVKDDAALQAGAPSRRRGRRRRARLRGRRGDPHRPARGRGCRAPTSTSGCRTTCARRCSWPSSRTCSPATSPSCTGSRARRAPSWARRRPGVDALRIAQARIASGQIDAMLVGGSYSAERPDVMVDPRDGRLPRASPTTARSSTARMRRASSSAAAPPS